MCSDKWLEDMAKQTFDFPETDYYAPVKKAWFDQDYPAFLEQEGHGLRKYYEDQGGPYPYGFGTLRDPELLLQFDSGTAIVYNSVLSLAPQIPKKQALKGPLRAK